MEIGETLNPEENTWGDDYASSLRGNKGLDYVQGVGSKQNNPENRDGQSPQGGDNPNEPDTEGRSDQGAQSTESQNRRQDSSESNGEDRAEGLDSSDRETSDRELDEANSQGERQSRPQRRQRPPMEGEENTDSTPERDDAPAENTDNGESGNGQSEDTDQPASETDNKPPAESNEGDDSTQQNTDVDSESPEANGDDTGEAELTQEQRYQEALKRAAESGKPVVVIFGSKEALDTQKLTEQTLQQNYENDQAEFMYVDTDNLDPNSDLGKVARRSEEQGLGLGPDGKPNGTDMVFTGIYNVEQKADGSFGLGKSTATFWGGRESISKTMQEQMKYAKSSTLDLNPSVNDNPQGGDNPSRPVVDDDGSSNGSDNRPQEEESSSDRSAEDSRERENESEEDRQSRLEQEKEEAERKKKYKERFESVTGRDVPTDREGNEVDPQEELQAWADSWRDFVETEDVPEGDFRNLMQEAGSQLVMGEFDAQKMQDLMSKVQDSPELQQTLQSLNDGVLGRNGLKMNMNFDENGKLASMDLMAKPSDTDGGAGMRIFADGNIFAGGKNAQGQALTKQQALNQMAKKASPLACP